MGERPVIDILTPGLTLVLALAFSLAPIMPSANALTGPHWLLVVACFWAQRRPGAAPALLLFPFLLVYEMLRDGPLGIELMTVLVATETLAYVARRYPPYSLPDEWVRFALATLAMEALLWLALAAAYVPTPSVSVLLTRWSAGLALYLLLIVSLGRLRAARRIEDSDTLNAQDLTRRWGR